LATTTALQGYASLGDGAAAGRPVGLLLLAAAAALAAGVLTVVAAGLALTALISAIAFSIPLAMSTGYGPAAPAAFVGSVCVVIMLLGPGGYSLDARLFGRREIVIPRASRTPE
jgi:hypothetical protein